MKKKSKKKDKKQKNQKKAHLTIKKINKNLKNKNLKNKSKKNIKICYTGRGTTKTKKNHTKKEFLKIMNKNFKKSCIEFIHSNKCKECIRKKKIIKKHIKYSNSKNKKKYSKKKEKEILEILINPYCDKIKEIKTSCDLDEYLLFSGAVLGKCK